MRATLRRIPLCGAAVVLAACASGPRAPVALTYGNYAGASAAFNQKLAGDAVKQLVALFPPASTQFNITQAATDLFGSALIAGLREKGYGVMEFAPDSTPALPAVADKDASVTTKNLAGIELRYLVDQQGAGDFYRLVLAIGSQRLTRAYMAQNEGTYAAGAWVRKE